LGEVEFPKFIDHRGLVVNFPWARWPAPKLACAYTLSGDTAIAKAAYLDFFTFRKDPIPTFPS